MAFYFSLTVKDRLVKMSQQLFKEKIKNMYKK